MSSAKQLKSNPNECGDLEVWTKERQVKLRDAYQKNIEAYLSDRYPEMDKDQRDKIVESTGALYEVQQNTETLMDVEKAKKPSFYSRAVEGVEKTLGSKWLRGGAAMRERLMTIGVFTGAGYLARELPVIREVLMGYAGMKLGELGADIALRKLGDKRYEILKQIKAEELTPDSIEENPQLLTRARLQLADKKWKQENPTEFQAIFETVNAREEEAIKDAENLLQFMGQRTAEMEDAYIEKRQMEREAKTVKNGFRIAGALGGAVLGGMALDSVSGMLAEETAETAKPAMSAEDQAEIVKILKTPEYDPTGDLSDAGLIPPVAEGPPLPEQLPTIEVSKGDTVWGLIKERLNQRYGTYFENLQDGQKAYLIDHFKDMVVDNPAEYGLDDPHTLEAGQKFDIASLLGENAMVEVLEDVEALTPEQLTAIESHKELLESVFSKPIDKVSDEDLRKGYEVLGGSRHPESVPDAIRDRYLERFAPNSMVEHAKGVLIEEGSTEEIINEHLVKRSGEIPYSRDQILLATSWIEEGITKEALIEALKEKAFHKEPRFFPGTEIVYQEGPATTEAMKFALEEIKEIETVEAATPEPGEPAPHEHAPHEDEEAETPAVVETEVPAEPDIEHIGGGEFATDPETDEVTLRTFKIIDASDGWPRGNKLLKEGSEGSLKHLSSNIRSSVQNRVAKLAKLESFHASLEEADPKKAEAVSVYISNLRKAINGMARRVVLKPKA